MPTLDATVGGLASNSYLTIEQSLAIAELVLSGPAYQAFLNQATDDRSVCLMRATRMIERSFEWSGFQCSDAQALAWPRSRSSLSGAFYIENAQIYSSGVIPRDVQDATVLLASHIAQGFSELDSLATQATNIKLGPIAITLDSKKGKAKSTIPEDVISVLSKVGEYVGVASGGRVVNLERH